jgi:flagellar biogenesis protein FliO
MKTWLMWVALAVVVWVSSGTASAQPEAAAAKGGSFSGPVTYTPPALPERPAAGAMLLRLGLAITFVLVLSGLALYLAYQRAKGPRVKGGGGKLKLVESFALGGGSWLHLIQSAGQRFVVAVNRGGLQSLVPLAESFEETFASLRENPLEPTRRAAAPRSRVA